MSFIRPQLRPVRDLSNWSFKAELRRVVEASGLSVDPKAIFPGAIPRSRSPRRRRSGRRTHQQHDDDDGPNPEHGPANITDLGQLPALLTVEEVANVLRTTANAVYVMASRGKLPGGVHVGRRLLVRRTELMTFLNEGRVPSPARSR